MELSDLFYYCAESYTGLRRKLDWCSGRNGSTVKAYSGDPTGSICHGKHKYYDVFDGKKLRRAHVVIWLLEMGEIPEGYVIDHKDGNGLNNNLSNLRCILHQHNSHNQRKSVKNKSGVTGVHLRYYKDVPSRWIAQWHSTEGKRKCMHFSIKMYGYDEAFRLACEYRKKMIEQLNSEGAAYTERHGT